MDIASIIVPLIDQVDFIVAKLLISGVGLYHLYKYARNSILDPPKKEK